MASQSGPGGPWPTGARLRVLAPRWTSACGRHRRHHPHPDLHRRRFAAVLCVCLLARLLHRATPLFCTSVLPLRSLVRYLSRLGSRSDRKRRCCGVCVLVSRASCRLPTRSAAMSSAVRFSIKPKLHHNYITTTSQLHQNYIGLHITTTSHLHHNYITTTSQLHHNYTSLHIAIKRRMTSAIYIKAPPPSALQRPFASASGRAIRSDDNTATHPA